MHYNNYKAVFDRTMLSVVCVITLNNPQPKYNQCRLIVVSRLPAVCVCVCVGLCVLCLYGMLVIKVQDIAGLCSLSTGIVFTSLYENKRQYSGMIFERRSLSLIWNLSQSKPSPGKASFVWKASQKRLEQWHDDRYVRQPDRLNCLVSFLTGQTCWTPRWNQTPASAFGFQWKNEADKPACSIVSKQERRKTLSDLMRMNSKITNSWPWC